MELNEKKRKMKELEDEKAKIAEEVSQLDDKDKRKNHQGASGSATSPKKETRYKDLAVCLENFKNRTEHCMERAKVCMGQIDDNSEHMLNQVLKNDAIVVGASPSGDINSSRGSNKESSFSSDEEES